MGRLLTDRNRNMLSGAIGLLLLLGAITVGIKASFGAFDGGYDIQASFASAGQGLLEGSDVKIRGLNVGEVSSIELVENRALVTMTIDDGVDIPTTSEAVIRPKTLFGEKFVDVIPGVDELTGPYLASAAPADECPGRLPCLLDTLGGFELEQVLTDTYPVLEAIDPVELAVVLDELATAADGLGLSVNRSIVNAATLTELAASNDDEFRQFTADLALLSEELDRLAPDLLAGARDLNVALPSLNARADELNTALVQLARLTGDVADLLENNRSFTENALTNGSETLALLDRQRGQLQPLLDGIEKYTRTLSEAIRVPVGDGTLMAAVKMVVDPGYLISHNLETAMAEQAAPPAVTNDASASSGPSLEGALEGTRTTVERLLDLLVGGDR